MVGGISLIWAIPILLQLLNALFTGLVAVAVYCLKCRTRTETANLEQVILKNGRPAAKGL